MLIVIEEFFAAKAGDSRRVRLHAESPQRHIDVVNPVVSDVATAKVVPPTPNARQHVRAIRHQRRGAHPAVEVELWRRLAGLCLANRSAALAVPGLRYQ